MDEFTALIVGISGQDGAYLAKLLLSKGYKVYGSTRDSSTCDTSKLSKLKILKDINLLSLAPNDFRNVIKVVNSINPDEVYYLAGLTSVGLSFEQPVECMESISLGVLNFLEAIKLIKKNIKFFNAGSSECFGNTNKIIANETTFFSPRSPYATAKATAFWMVSNYRESYSLFCCTGILGNHESPLRNKRFVTKKIVSGVWDIVCNKSKELRLGNLDTWRDWGWAPEYVEAMYLMLQAPEPQDYVIATGETNSLREFVSMAFKKFNLEESKFIIADESLLRPSDIKYSFLNPSKIFNDLNWKSKKNLESIIDSMFEDFIKQGFEE